MAISNVACWIGTIVLCFGGSFLALYIIGLLAYFATDVWVVFSEKFRRICKAESLIFEYRRNRTEFMAWKELKEMQEDGK